MKQLIIWFLILLLMIFTASWLQKNGLKISQNSGPAPATMKIGEKSINVEVVKTSSDLAKGLSERDSLPADQGMLFVMSKNSVPAFWMKDMRFAIDIIWVDDKKVVDVSKRIPAPEANISAEDLPRYRPAKPADYVLEVNAGFADENGIKEGTTVDLPAGI